MGFAFACKWVRDEGACVSVYAGGVEGEGEGEGEGSHTF
jgi:hypothetical protein